MSPITLPLLLAAAAPLLLAAATAPDPILVTASRTPIAQDDIPVSATVIDAERIDALGEMQAVDLLRLSPGVAVSVTGSRGTQAQVRIRGAEANHSLLFIDGIAFNDPAAGNEPRFETLTADGLSRIEIVRGPQSALWGSEAIGGVIALDSRDPLAGTMLRATGEYGSRDSVRGALSGTISGEHAGVTLTASHAREDGIDVLGGGSGDHDGYSNTTVAALAIARPGENGEFGLAARYIHAYSAFDGLDSVFFTRADTFDNAKTDTAAIRGWARIGLGDEAPWSAQVDAQYLTSDNRNFLADAPLNRTQGDRARFGAELVRRFDVGGTHHVLVAAVEQETEEFAARDQQYFGATDQDRTRERIALVGEWRAQWGERLATDIAARHDDFDSFTDATTVRTGARLTIVAPLALFASYGEGIAQPTFFDLYGFFPGNFAGNPVLRPERSRGYETGIEWRGDRWSASLTGFRATLRDEIVSVFDPATFLSSTANADGRSTRKGIEVAAAWRPLTGLRIDANYTLLDAEDQQSAGGLPVREPRRPRHSANLAMDWRTGPLTLGAALAYVGRRRDTDFDTFPAREVVLDDYVLGSVRLAYALTDAIEVFGRFTNLFDEEYQDVVGYRTPGRAAYAGLRLRLGDQ